MRRKAPFIAAIAIGLSSMGVASACEFHGGGFGPPGSSWQAYYGTHDQNDYSADDLTGWAQEQVEAERKTETELFLRRPIQPPTFSNAATRAADTAKSRLSVNKFRRKMGLRVIDNLMRPHASSTYR